MKSLNFANQSLFLKFCVFIFLFQNTQSHGAGRISRCISSCYNLLPEWYKRDKIEACQIRMNKVYAELNEPNPFQELAESVCISFHGSEATRELMFLHKSLPIIRHYGGGRAYASKLRNYIDSLNNLLNACNPIYTESLHEFEILKQKTDLILNKLYNLENILKNNKDYFKLQKFYSQLNTKYTPELAALEKLNHPCNSSIALFIADAQFIADIRRTNNFCCYNRYPCKSYLQRIQTDLNDLAYNCQQFSQKYPQLVSNLNNLYNDLNIIKNCLLSDVSFKLEYEDELRRERLYLEEQERARQERERLRQIEERYRQQREIDRLNRKVRNLETENLISNIAAAFQKPKTVYVPVKQEVVKEVVYVPVKEEKPKQTTTSDNNEKETHNSYQDKMKSEIVAASTDDDLPPASDY